MSEAGAKHRLVAVHDIAKNLAKFQKPGVGIIHATVVARAADKNDVVLGPGFRIAVVVADNVACVENEGVVFVQALKFRGKAFLLLGQHRVVGVSNLEKKHSHGGRFSDSGAHPGYRTKV